MSIGGSGFRMYEGANLNQGILGLVLPVVGGQGGGIVAHHVGASRP